MFLLYTFNNLTVISSLKIVALKEDTVDNENVLTMNKSTSQSGNVSFRVNVFGQ